MVIPLLASYLEDELDCDVSSIANLASMSSSLIMVQCYLFNNLCPMFDAQVVHAYFASNTERNYQPSVRGAM